MSRSIQDIENEIVEEFGMFDNQMDKYEYLIDIGNQLPPLEAQYMVDENLVKGCQSKVWLHAFKKDGLIFFEADSNSAITKGLIALLVRVLSGQRGEEIAANPLHFIDRINLRSHLSSQRSNGLSAMILKMKRYATEA